MTLKGFIDSIAFDLTDDILTKLSEIGVIQVAKNGLVFNQELLTEFKTISKAKYYDYLSILHTQRGLQYEITKLIVSKRYKLTFRGLKQYSEVSKLMRDDLQEVIALIGMDNLRICRLDVCFDQIEPFNMAKIAMAYKRREYKFKNTTYLKTDKEKKTNRNLDIRHYKKGLFYRLEFSFKRSYLVSGLNEAKLSKVIKKGIKKHFKFESIAP
jgi:hypothetical protein